MATARSELRLSGEQIAAAAENYIDCLNLTPGSQVVVVGDRKLGSVEYARSQNLALRREMSDKITGKLLVAGYDVKVLFLDNDMSKEEMYGETERVLGELDQAIDKPTTVVYLGDAWDNRAGMYDAIGVFGAGREVRVAGSLGFSTGDCRVMSQLTAQRREKIAQASRYFEEFFAERPQGRFAITTVDDDGREHQLELDYDTAEVPFHTDMGAFDEDHEVRMGNFAYVNIPGGETFTSPFPFTNTQGSFAAEGIVFRIEDGLVVGVEAPEEVLSRVTEPSQALLIKTVRSGTSMPLVELGLGFYALAGVETFSDSSVLSREKGGPHIGMGTASWDTPEGEQMQKLAKGFHHTDFVMGKEVIINWVDPETGRTELFYPPKK